MSASEVTDFQRSFRYFAIWLHGQVFSKLLLGLFFQCQKSAWTYFEEKRKKKTHTVSPHRGKNKAEFEASVFMSVHLHTCACVSLDLPKAKPSLPTHLLPSPTWHMMSCWVPVFLTLSEAPKYNVTALLSSADLDLGRAMKPLSSIRKSCWASLGWLCTCPKTSSSLQ